MVPRECLISEKKSLPLSDDKDLGASSLLVVLSLKPTHSIISRSSVGLQISTPGPLPGGELVRTWTKGEA